ncbi:N-acetyltransferase family protein [Modestobacter sp. SYSU DS0290]
MPSEQVTVRPAEPADHPALRALAGELATGVAIWRPEAAARTAAEGWVAEACRGSGDDRALLVACDPDGRVLGFAGVAEQRHFTGQVDAYLGELVVAPAARRRGVAVQLVRAAEHWAGSRGLGRLTLETGAANAAARELYSRLGYREEQVTLTRVLS